MSIRVSLLAGAAGLILATAGPALAADEAPGKGVTIYMQMGGQSGEGPVLAREIGAAAAAKGLGVDKLNAQYLGLVAGEDDRPVQGGARRQAVLHRHHGPSGLRRLQGPRQAGRGPGRRRHRRQRAADRAAERCTARKGFGYSGVDLYEGGALTANEMIKAGSLKSGDEAMVYGVFSFAERGQSEKGLADTLEKAGLKVDRLEISPEINSDVSLAVPVLAAYVQSHPNLKAIGTQHGGVTGVHGGRAQEGRQEAGRDHRRRHRPRPRHDRRAEVGLCHR